MDHRGRIQAQGQYLEESESWAQEIALLYAEGVGLLNDLENKIPKKERLNRARAFKLCRKCIDAASENNGINVDDMGKPFIKSFPKNYKERVDLEVRRGIAFIKNHDGDGE